MLRDGWWKGIRERKMSRESMRLPKKGAAVSVAVLLVVVFSLTAFFYLPVIQAPYQTVGSCNALGCVQCEYMVSLSAWLFGIGFRQANRCMMP